MSPSEPSHAESSSENEQAWPVRTFEPLGLQVGPCAWRASMLVGQTSQASEQALAYVLKHPSLLIVEPEDGDDVMAQAAKAAGQMPVMICMHEPDFARRLAEQIRKRIAQLNREKIAGVILRVEELSDLKAGGVLHAMFGLREEGAIEHVGLATQDARGAEWLSPQTAARVLMLPYSLDDQSARYRALTLVGEMGQFCIASEPLADVNNEAVLSFALGESARVLPVLDQPLPANWRAMTEQQVEVAWANYQTQHPAPAKLPRSHAPD